MATDKRERQKANRQLKRQQLEKAEKRDQVRHYGFMAAIVAVALIGGLALLSLSGDDEPEDIAADTTETDAASSDAADSDAEPEGTDEPIDCPAEDGSSERILEFPTAPPMCIDESASFTAVMETNLGTVTAELDAAAAPLTVNNFVYLARYHYYDDTAFHRIIDDFVIQGGDPVGETPGIGNPGYFISEEPPADGTYELGSLAMAKQTAANTTGAQFFIVTGPQGEALPPQYSRFGIVTEGMDVVEEISNLPTDANDFPTEEIIVSSVTIIEN